MKLTHNFACFEETARVFYFQKYNKYAKYIFMIFSTNNVSLDELISAYKTKILIKIETIFSFLLINIFLTCRTKEIVIQ